MIELFWPAARRSEGGLPVDADTAALYRRLSARHAGFLHSLERPGPPRACRLLVVPASFYAQFPSIGGGGQRILRIAAELGIPATRLDTGSVATVDQGGQIVAGALETLADVTILVSLSKGGADVARALQLLGRWPPGLTWVNVGGLLAGTPLARALLAAPPWEQRVLRAYLRACGGSLQLVRDMLPRPPAPLPDGARLIHFAAFPDSRDLRASVARRHAYLAAFGPNDGTVVLEESLTAGPVVPVWGADHYFRTAEAHRRMGQLLRYLQGEPDRGG